MYICRASQDDDSEGRKNSYRAHQAYAKHRRTKIFKEKNLKVYGIIAAPAWSRSLVPLNQKSNIDEDTDQDTKAYK